MFFGEKRSPRARLRGIRTIPHTYNYTYNIYPILHYLSTPNTVSLATLARQINIPDFRLCYPCKCLARYARSPLTGITQLKIGDVCVFICMDVRMTFCTLTLLIFVFAPRSTPSQTSLNRILLFSDHYPYHLRN